MTAQTIEIDGRRAEFREGESLLQAAERAGVEIPTLCFLKGLEPEGGCRICLVETAPGRLQAACHTPALPGLMIRTSTPELHDLRKDLLELYLSAHPEAGFVPNAQGLPIERLMARLGIQAPNLKSRGIGVDSSHPYLRFSRARCIDCRRCLHACEEIQGQFVYGIADRGGASRLIFGPSETFRESPCVSCGTCVDACPTGAISDIDRIDITLQTSHTHSTCGYCGVGCRVNIETLNGQVVRIAGVGDAQVNRGHLCVKGRYAHAYHRSSDRLTEPLLREGDVWKTISWEEAISWLAKRLSEIKERHGPQTLGAFTSSRSTNEAAYLLQKLFRTRLETNNIDCCARVCHSSSALALQLVTGTGAASSSYDDIDIAKCIVLAGSNATEAHPVIGARIKQAVLRGAKLVVIDPRRIELAEYAGVHLQHLPGTNVPLFNVIAKLLVETNGVDQKDIEARTEGFAEWREALKSTSLSEVATITGVPERSIEKAAELLERSGPALFVWGLGLSELTQGTASVMTFAHLALLTGSVGKPGAGLLPLRGQNNVQGNADMGGMPNQTTGYQPVDDAAVRDHLKRIWGKAPPSTPGLTIPEMIDAAFDGNFRALWIQGEDIVQSDPNEPHVIAALKKLDLLVIQEMFFSETAKYAHLILPAAGALEQEGTFTNGERRIQLVRPAVPPPGKARADWDVIRDVGRAMGESWHYSSPSDVMDEIAKAAPHLFGGVAYSRLEPNGLQWPCPAPGHPGTHTVHQDKFLRGKALFQAVDYIASPESAVEGYPYLLITGRVLEHYNVGTMTRRTPNQALASADFLEIHPSDAKREKIPDGSTVEIESRWGKTSARVHATERALPGTLFLSFHYPETHANRLTSPYRDPKSKCPEYKVTSVRIRPRTPDSGLVPFLGFR